MNEIEKKFSAFGLKCKIVKTSMGHRCGYVAIPSKFKLVTSYDDFPVNIHGGLTYLDDGYMGFDCAHSGDTNDFWTLRRVESETRSLAKQVSKLEWKDFVEKRMQTFIFLPDWFKERITINIKKEGGV